MGASACIGRVGGLAVALGVGAAIATGGTALAWGAPAGEQTSNGDAVDAGTPRAHNTPTRRAPSARKSGDRNNALPSAGSKRAEKPVPQPVSAQRAVQIQLPGVAPAPATALSVSGAVPGPVPVAPVPALQIAGPGAAMTAAPIATAVESALRSLAYCPGSPAQSTANWVMLAAVRRMGRQQASVDPTAGSMVTSSAVAAATGGDPFSSALFNQTPTLNPTKIDQSPTGVVTGSLGGVDADSSPLSYTVTGAPAHGSLSVDGSGNYTYTPDAALAHGGYTDSFQVTVSDAGTGFHVHGLMGLINLLTFGLVGDSGHTTTSTVSVTVAAVNKVPTANLTAGVPNPGTGVVLGAVTAADADGDPLTYSTIGATKGTVAFDAAGNFTYTPTATARHNAASLTATAADKVDNFSVIVNDGHTGTVTLPVSVSIVASNAAPTAAPSVGSPNPSTGVVAGALNPVDADGDSLTYLSAGATKGAVSLGANGSFTYTPTAAARHNAAAVDATAADKADSFSITISDGHGGSLAVPIAVTIAAVNATPATATSVGSPNGSTGVVLGAVTATDADSDPLSFTGSTTTAKGAVVIAADGSFTYTPTATARHNAAATGATQADKTDTFTVTVADGHGGSVAVPVVVSILPTNADPTVSSSTVGTPDATSGVVAGAVLGADADSDPLAYAAAGSAKGAVAFGSGGSFTYTPTATARHNAAALTATAADKADAFTVTVSDGHGGSVAVPITVAVGPANAAPTGSASVGAANATTGLVAGTVLGVDGDTDALTYTTTGAAKGTVTLNANGTFTYTPTTTARHDAFLQSATAADKADTFTVTITDGYGGSVDVPVTVAVAPAGVSFTFTYGSGSNYWTNAARTALNTAAANLASYIVVATPVTVTYDVIGQSTGSSLLASASATFTGVGAGYYGTVIQTKILSGTDYNGAAADSTITWNFGHPWDYDDNIGNRAYDFQAVALHELLHSFGFLTGVGDPAGLDRNWSTYDKFLTTSTGTKVIDANYTWISAYTGNLTGSGGGLYFGGPTAVAVYGGPVPLYTPSTWASGSSVSHLDPTMPLADTHVMNPSDGYGLGARAISDVELAILTDLGYTVTPTPVVAFVFIGIGFIRRRRP